MPSARFLFVSLALVAACQSQAETEDASAPPDDAPGALTCVQLVDALRARIAATSTTCDVAGDCDRVGNALASFGAPSCNEAIAFANQCYGDAVNRAAWAADAEAAELQRQWYTRCVPLGIGSGVMGYYDCAPGLITCDNHTCRSAPQSCFIDAGVN